MYIFASVCVFFICVYFLHLRKTCVKIFRICEHNQNLCVSCAHQDFIVDLKNQTYHTFQLLPELVQPLQELWQHPALRKAFSKRAQMDYNDNAEYFVKELNRLSSPDYTPTMDDVLRTRQRTLGITENTFDIDKAKFKMVDVGGQVRMCCVVLGNRCAV